MDVTMTYATQDLWTWWLAVYLYTGGLGAATLAVTILTAMYLKPHRNLVLWGAGAGVVLLALGSAMGKGRNSEGNRGNKQGDSGIARVAATGGQRAA